MERSVAEMLVKPAIFNYWFNFAWKAILWITAMVALVKFIFC